MSGLKNQLLMSSSVCHLLIFWFLWLSGSSDLAIDFHAGRVVTFRSQHLPITSNSLSAITLLNCPHDSLIFLRPSLVSFEAKVAHKMSGNNEQGTSHSPEF
ncbi:hypothetical protein F5Y05DRAFT_367911 [Hypoxylon sp. FL0543]|nr:hypothetical protein F5Y05DRAFT_367911 [Hypoxylon sp. FL0543]